MTTKAIVRKRSSTRHGPFRVDEVQLQVQRRDGTYQDQERVSFERGDSVAVLVHRFDIDAIVLARQFRYPVLANVNEQSDGMILELPAGVLKEGETPQQTAVREVDEELGYTLKGLEHIATFFVSPGGTSERVIVFYAAVEGSPQAAGGGLAAEGEDIEAVTLPVADFIAKIDTNEIRDGKTLLAGFWFMVRHAGNR
jgi:nudix-type nucleoside diphosphatase (YffH/AdpP family)